MRASKVWVAVLAVIAATVVSGEAAAQGRSPNAQTSLQDPSYTHVPSELLVQYRRGATDADKERAQQRIGAAFVEEVALGVNRFDGGDLELVRLPPGLVVAAAMRGIELDPAVQFAEPN